jgi:hypothetical protein
VETLTRADEELAALLDGARAEARLQAAGDLRMGAAAIALDLALLRPAQGKVDVDPRPGTPAYVREIASCLLAVKSTGIANPQVLVELVSSGLPMRRIGGAIGDEIARRQSPEVLNVNGAGADDGGARRRIIAQAVAAANQQRGHRELPPAPERGAKEREHIQDGR